MEVALCEFDALGLRLQCFLAVFQLLLQACVLGLHKVVLRFEQRGVVAQIQ